MIVFPAAATVVSLAFALHLLLRFIRRGRMAEGVWAVALLMYAAASGALTSGVVGGWTPFEFRVYWLLGAVLTVPYLGLGEIYLLARRPWVGHVGLVVVLAATAWATLEVRTAPVDASVLAEREFFSGREILGEESTARTLSMIYSYTGTAILVLGILWSAAGLRARPDLRNRLYGTLLIAGGAIVVAAGAAFARAANLAGFSVTLAAGVAVMYWGFLTATRRKATQPSSSPLGDQGARDG